MPKATTKSLYEIAQNYQLISLFQNKLSSTESSAELNDLIDQLKNVNSALNTKLKTIHLAIGTNHGEYDGHQSSPSAFVLPFFNSHAKDSVLEKKVAFCFFLFILYHFSTNTNQSAILQAIISDALKEVFQYATTLLTPETSNKDAVKVSLLTLFSMKLVTVKKTKTSRQETVLAGPPQAINVIEIPYTKIEHIDTPYGAFYYWVTANTEVFELFKELGILLGSEGKHQFTWEFLTLSLRTYVLSLRKLTEGVDNSISAPIVTGLLALLGNASITMETTSKTGKVSQGTRHRELLVHPNYYETGHEAQLYENYISEIFPSSTENLNINQIKIAFLEAILLNRPAKDPLVKFLSNSKKGISYLCKLVADYSLLTYTKPENLNTFNPLTENDSLTTEDIMLERPISNELAKILPENYAQNGTNKEALRKEIINDKDLLMKISNIRKAINPGANTLLSTIFYTPRGRFFAQTPSADNSRSQLSKLKAELPLTEKELAIAFFKEHKLPMPERLKKDFIELEFDSTDISEHLENDTRKSTLELSDIGQGTPASRESFVLNARLSMWDNFRVKTGSSTSVRYSITTAPHDLPTRAAPKK